MAESGKTVYFPRYRVLFDLFLTLNIFFFVLDELTDIPNALNYTMMGGLNVVLLLSWFVFIRPMMRVECTSNSITGPSPSFSKITIPFRKINHKEVSRRHHGMHHVFFKDIPSVEGTCVRLQRHFLGQAQVTSILDLIEKYPFRDSA